MIERTKNNTGCQGLFSKPAHKNPASWLLRIVAADISLVDKDGAEIIDIGAGWPGDDEAAGPGKKTVSIIVVEIGAWIDPVTTSLRQSSRRDDGAGIILRPVDA